MESKDFTLIEIKLYNLYEKIVYATNDLYYKYKDFSQWIEKYNKYESKSKELNNQVNQYISIANSLYNDWEVKTDQGVAFNANVLLKKAKSYEEKADDLKHSLCVNEEGVERSCEVLNRLQKELVISIKNINNLYYNYDNILNPIIDDYYNLQATLESLLKSQKELLLEEIYGINDTNINEIDKNTYNQYLKVCKNQAMQDLKNSYSDKLNEYNLMKITIEKLDKTNQLISHLREKKNNIINSINRYKKEYNNNFDFVL